MNLEILEPIYYSKDLSKSHTVNRVKENSSTAPEFTFACIKVCTAVSAYKPAPFCMTTAGGADCETVALREVRLMCGREGPVGAVAREAGGAGPHSATRAWDG